jgi:hypothetical protein
MKSYWGGALVLLVAFLSDSGAQAAQRHAAPTGSGTTCSQAAPCSLEEAIKSAKASDEVIVGGGGYTLSASVALPFAAEGAWVHGDFGGPPPTIAAAFAGATLAVTAPKSRLSYVDLKNSATSAAGFYCGVEGTVERVRATVEGIGSFGGGLLQSCTVRDSLMLATGKGAIGLYTSCEATTLHARNVTVIAAGEGSAGVRAYNTNFEIVPPAKTCGLDLRNAIASGEVDLQTYNALQGIVNIDVHNSNFATVKPAAGSTIGGASNQAAPPLFVSPAAGDYREAAGSPTIDAGAPDPLNGSADLDGSPRTVGPAPDIGAFEYVPPTPPSLPPPAAGRIQLLKLSPQRFRTANVGGAIVSAKKKRRAPVGARVAYSLSAPATVRFSVERRAVGRRVGKRCVRRTRANRGKRHCVRFAKVRGGFSDGGGAGVSRFRFSGRVGGRALRPGRHRLVARAGGATKRAPFRVVR